MLCAHGVLWHWLFSGYASDTQPFATGMWLNPQLHVVKVLNETKVFLVSLICFCPTDEWLLILAYDKGKPEFLFWIIILCIPPAVCRSEVIASKSSWSLYSMHVLCVSYLDRIFSYQYLLLRFCCGYFNLSIAKAQRQPIFQHTLARTYSFVLGLTGFLNFRTRNWTSMCWHWKYAGISG